MLSAKKKSAAMIDQEEQNAVDRDIEALTKLCEFSHRELFMENLRELLSCPRVYGFCHSAYILYYSSIFNFELIRGLLLKEQRACITVGDGFDIFEHLTLVLLCMSVTAFITFPIWAYQLRKELTGLPALLGLFLVALTVPLSGACYILFP